MTRRTKRIVIGIAAPVVVQAIVAVPIGALEQRGWDLTWVVAGWLMVTTTGGFAALAKPLTARQRWLVALVYYPTVLLLSLYVGLLVVGRLYGAYL